MSTTEQTSEPTKVESTEPVDPTGTHPCERVFGTCQAGETCPFKDAPRSACVAFLKGKCRFGARCREPHVQQGRHVAALHPCLRVYGSCRYGDQCAYANMVSETCVKYLKGRCSFGDRCKELHPGGFGFMGGMSGMGMAGMGMSGMGMGMGMAQGMGMGAGMGMAQMGMGLPQMQQMQSMGMMPYGAMAYPYVAQNFGTGQEVEGGVLRGGKRGREGETLTGFKRHQGDQSQFMMNPNYYQQTAGGQMHPCVRIYGSCRDGAWCKFSLMPIGACLQYLKGSCKFGDACHEPHLQMPGQEHRNMGPGAKHPCERIYGFCQDGERCRFIDFPAESCLMFLKGKCKFGDGCRELHTRGAVEVSPEATTVTEEQPADVQ